MTTAFVVDQTYTSEAYGFGKGATKRANASLFEHMPAAPCGA